MRAFAILAFLALAATVQASDSLSPSVVADGSRYYRDTSVTTTAEAHEFPAGGFSCLVYNEDSSNALLVKFVRHTDAVAAEELTAASNAWSEVQSIPAGETFTFDVRKSRGVILDRAAGTGAVTLRLID